MEVFSNIVLNLQAPAFATVFSPQGQTLSRSIQATMMDGATPWEIPETALCIIRYAKPDGTKGFYDTLEDDSSAYSYNGNVVTFGLATQALTVPGTVLMQLDFYNSDGEKLSTFTFRLIVAPGVFADSDITSSDYFNVLTAKLTEAAQIFADGTAAAQQFFDENTAEAQQIFDQIKQVYGAPWTAATADAMTDTSRVYVYTGTTTDTLTNGHWYYWDGSAWADGGNYNSTGFTTDTTLTIAGAAADAKATGDAIGYLKSALNSIEDFSWSPGFINSYGNVDSASDPNRKHSEYLLCPPETNVTYISETNHSAVLGISFYDENKIFISGVANNGTMGTAQTVSSPKRTRYCRLSTKLAIIYQSYYAPATRTLLYVEKTAMDNKDNLANRTDGYIKFGTNGSIRGDAVSITGLLYAQVVDNDYDISLSYKSAGGSDTSTNWLKYIRLCEYKQPTALKIRKSDNSAMPVASANTAVVGTYMAGLATNGYVYKATGTAYVDGTDGSDTNDGLNQTTAFATIQKAIDGGYKNILVREGTYTGGIALTYADGVHISINKKYSEFNESTASANPKVIIDCGSSSRYGFLAYWCNNCVFEGIEVKNATVDGFNMQYCENMTFNDCVSHDCPTGNGFTINYTNGIFRNCGCYNIGTMGGGQHHDGFNIHGSCTTSFVNCWANYCEDDGISHHDACEGYVDGGEWHHCGKGGVCTPTHGAKIDVRNVYVHDCGYGINAGNDTVSLAKTFAITNCVCLDNTNYDIYVTNNTANIWNCIYDTISHTGTGTNNILMASS